MLTKSKTAKFVAGFVGFTMALGIVVAPATAGAATVSELEALIAQLTAQLAGLSGGSSGSYMFSADLTIGSTGADVVALQDFLIGKGFLTMPAGVAKGYFGALTQSALAAFQAANGISPAAGYFGPITRAKVNGMMTSSPSNPSNPSSPSGLQGGEASLENFDMQDEESSGHEGEEDVQLATASFDVEDGDAAIERVEIDFQAESTSDSVRPWDYFDNISIWMNGEMIDDMDVNSRADWNDDDDDSDHSASSADWYRITFTGLDEVVREGDTPEITVAANIAGTIDTEDITQEFTVLIPDDGIRATDGEGIQQYTGDFDEVADNFGFDQEESGDIDLETNSGDPDTMTLISDPDNESDEYSVFMFDMDNNDSVDSLVTDLTLTVATSSGDALTDIIDNATLVVGGDEFDGDINADGTIDFDDIEAEVAGDETTEFELVITLKEDAPESTIDFSVTAADVTAEGVDSGDDATVSGTVSSETHTVSAAGILVEGTDKSTSISDDGDTGTFTLEFTVEALEEDVYIYNGATDFAYASTSGLLYKIYKNGTAGAAATTTDGAVIQSSADTAGLASAWYVVNSGETETFTLTVTLNPDSVTPASALWSVEIESIRFDDDAITTVGDTDFVLPNDAEFETNALQID